MIFVYFALVLLVMAYGAYIGLRAADEFTQKDRLTRPRGRIAEWYSGAVIIVTCSTCLLPEVLFVMAVWDRAAVLAVAVLLGSMAIALVVGRLVPERYFAPLPIERDGRMYRWLGVRAFKFVVPDGDLLSRVARRRGDRDPGMGFHRAAHSALETRGRIAERAHLTALIAALPLAALAAVLDRPGFALVLLVPNLVFHAYPVMLQRYTRARLHAIARPGR